MQRFKNLVFDIGNVIINIDYALPVIEFQKLAEGDVFTPFKAGKMAERFEKGQISEHDFFRGLQDLLRPGVSEQEIRRAWNSILTGYPKEKFELLKKLRHTYRVLALSNINEAHLTAIDHVLQKQFGAASLSDFFDVAYYSCRIGWRKPEKEIYQYVLDREKIKPEETFFVDDTAENVSAAQALGLCAFQLTKPDRLNELLTELHIV